MVRRVFDSYHAPDEETAGVKDALDEAGIEWYETTKGRWWVGSAGLWVKDDQDFEPARRAIDTFQQQWVQSRRDAHIPGKIRWGRVPVLIVVVGLILYLMTFWFWL